MFDIEKGSRVFYGGNKWSVAGVSDREVKLQDVRDWPYVPRDAVKSIIRLTPLVRAEMLVQAVGDLIAKSNWDGTPVVAVYPRGVRVTWPHFKEITNAVRVIQSIGGYEAAQLYTDCDGCVNGRFIRGDDVRLALRILEGL